MDQTMVRLESITRLVSAFLFADRPLTMSEAATNTGLTRAAVSKLGPDLGSLSFVKITKGRHPKYVNLDPRKKVGRGVTQYRISDQDAAKKWVLGMIEEIAEDQRVYPVVYGLLLAGPLVKDEYDLLSELLDQVRKRNWG